MKDALSTTGERLLGLASRLFTPPLLDLETDLFGVLRVLAVDLEVEQTQVFAPFTGAPLMPTNDDQAEEAYALEHLAQSTHAKLYRSTDFRTGANEDETASADMRPLAEPPRREGAPDKLLLHDAPREENTHSSTATPPTSEMGQKPVAEQMRPYEIVFPALSTVLRGMGDPGISPPESRNGTGVPAWNRTNQPSTEGALPPDTEPGSAARSLAIEQDPFAQRAEFPAVLRAAPVGEGRTTQQSSAMSAGDEEAYEKSIPNSGINASAQGLHMAQGSSGIAALLAANLAHNGSPAELASANEQDDSVPAKRDRSVSEQPEEYDIAGLIKSLAEELELEYIRFYGTSGR